MFKKLNKIQLIILTVLLSVTATIVIAATANDKFSFTVSTPRLEEVLTKGGKTNILWSITGTEENLDALIGQERISRIYLMERVYKTSGATSRKTIKLLEDIPLEGEVECNEEQTVCSLNQSYEWTISAKLKSSSSYFIRVYLRPKPNLFSGLAKMFTLNNRWVYDESNLFTVKTSGETLASARSSSIAIPCTPKLSYVQINDVAQRCCVGLEACQVGNTNRAICLSHCDAETVKEETASLPSAVTVTGTQNNTVTQVNYPSSLVSNSAGGTFDNPSFSISKNSDGTYKISWYNGTPGPENAMSFSIKDQNGKTVFTGGLEQMMSAIGDTYNVSLDGKQKYTIILTKIFKGQTNSYTFDSSLIEAGAKITNNVLNKPFETKNSFFSFFNTAISIDGKSFGVDFDLKDIYGSYATYPVRRMVFTLSDGTQKEILVDLNFMMSGNRGIILPLTAGNNKIKVDLYDSGNNKIETRTLEVGTNQNITSVTDYKGATGWGSVYDPSVTVGGVTRSFINAPSVTSYTIGFRAKGAAKIVVMDANGVVIRMVSDPTTRSFSGSEGGSLQFTGSQILPGQDYYINFYDNQDKLTYTEYFKVDDKGKIAVHESLADPSFTYSTCDGGRYYIANEFFPEEIRKTLTFVGKGDASAITFNKDGYIKASDLKPGQEFVLTYIDPIDGKLRTYNVKVTSDKDMNGGFKLSYSDFTPMTTVALDCAKQGKVCLDASRCKAGTIVGALNCLSNTLCCVDICGAPKVSCDGECIDSTTFTTNDNCGGCGIKCDTAKSEKCELKDSKYQCAVTAVVPTATCEGICQAECNTTDQVSGSGSCNDPIKSKCCKAKTAQPGGVIIDGSCLLDNSTEDCRAGLCDGYRTCYKGVWGYCIPNDFNCDPKTGKITSTPPSTPSCTDTCQPSGCTFSTQSVGNGKCPTLAKPYCCKNTPTTPSGTNVSPCVLGTTPCGSDCCTADKECISGKCVLKANGCDACNTAACGNCTNGYLCSCTGVGPNGTGHSSCTGGTTKSSSCPSSGTNVSPCVLGTTPCGSDCCTADKECISGKCVLKANGCDACNTAACGNCTNGYLCSCTGVGPNGTGHSSCTGGTTKSSSCPSSGTNVAQLTQSTCASNGGSCQYAECSSTQTAQKGTCSSAMPICCKDKVPTPTPVPIVNCYDNSTRCGTTCCSTAGEDCINNTYCQTKVSGCTKCATAACGGCSSLNNGYLCVCTGTKGVGYETCTGKKDPACPGFYAPSANALNIFGFLKQIFIKWFK